MVIIGAGLAGLTAADEILREDPRAKVTILEAMAEPGGRTKSVKIRGATFDLGAEWIGPPQKYAIELAKRSKSELLNQYAEGEKVLELGSEIRKYKTDIPQDVSCIQLAHMNMMMQKIDRLARTVPLDNPRMCPNAIEWDSMTVHTWF